MLGCNADTLYEFLQYFSEDNINFVFVNFDLDKIKLQKNFDDYKYNIIFTMLQHFVENYPNNTLEFI